MQERRAFPGFDGDKYVPVEKRNGGTSIVYFTRDISKEGLEKIFKRVREPLRGKIAIKVHTGEKNGPNIIPPSWVKELRDKYIPNGRIVETNTYYKGDRYTTEDHKETLKINGFDDVDILDEDGYTMLPINNGKWFDEMAVGKNLTNYDSLFVLTHFKGHIRGGFGGSNKNIGIGCADAKVGKRTIHTSIDSATEKNVVEEAFMERICESTKSVIDYFGDNISYVNVMRNMSVSCDCEGVNAKPVVTPDIGILASLDLVAIDNACIDLIYALKPEDSEAMRERIESKKGHRQLSYMQELGMGNRLYDLIDIDNGDKKITLEEAVKDVKPFVYKKMI